MHVQHDAIISAVPVRTLKTCVIMTEVPLALPGYQKHGGMAELLLDLLHCLNYDDKLTFGGACHATRNIVATVGMVQLTARLC